MVEVDTVVGEATVAVAMVRIMIKSVCSCWGNSLVSEFRQVVRTIS